MKQRLKFIVPAALLAAYAYWYWSAHHAFRYAGTVEATEVSLSPRIPAAIESVSVSEGDVVKKGQSLLTLDCSSYKLAADLAARDFARTERLFKEGSSPQEAYDRSRNKRDDTALQVSWCSIASPIDGTVLARLHEPGEWAATGTKILTLADLGAVFAYFYVPQTALFKLKPGQDVDVFLPETGAAARKGRIAFIRPEAEFTPKNVQTREERTRLVYGVKVLLENADVALKPGMPVEAALAQ
jgi:HlyD family secretion protein